MDRSSGKRGGNVSGTLRKTYKETPYKEAAAERDKSAQFCKRIGCSGRVKFNQNARVETSYTNKSSKPSLGSSSRNEVTGKSYSSNPSTTSAKSSCLDLKRETSDPSDSRHRVESMTKSKEVNMDEAGSSSASSSIGPRKTTRCKSGLRNESTSPVSPVPSASRSSAPGPSNRINGSRYGLRNLRCNSISDATTPSCSQPESESESVRNNLVKKRSSIGESSSSYRGRKNTAAPKIDQHTSPTTSGISISDLGCNNSVSEEDTSGSSSTWNRISSNINGRTRFSTRQDGRNSSRNDYETPFNVGDGSNSHQFSVSGSRSRPLSGINSDNSSSRTSFASAESGLTNLINHDVFRHFDMDHIAEVLIALDGIEQDEQLTDEQLLELETRLFFSSLNLYDQHRDMRLDIDNMSYEELLALEERMGFVSTALPKEALSKCLTRSIYEANRSIVETTESGEDTDDIQCSICQEEFETGDEIGNLVECQHGYHVTCINQWLQVKSWCPICKASAAPSRPSSAS